MGKNRLVFIAVLLIFLINAGLCWGSVVMPGHDVAAVFEKRIDTVIVIVVVKSSNSPDMGLLFAGVICSDGSNWYVYCGNNPVNYVDPTGEVPVPAAVYAVAAYISAIATKQLKD